MCSVPRWAPAFHLVVATLDWRNLMGGFDLEAGSVSLRTLLELRQLFWTDPEKYLIKVSASGRRESYER